MKTKTRNLASLLLVAGLSLTPALMAELSVTLTAPADGDRFDACSDVLFTADAVNTEGDVKYVYFFANGKQRRRDTREPWEYEWKNMQVGEYTVWAVVEDTEGNQAESSVITVTVGSPVEGNILVNGSFDCGLPPWQLQLFDVAEAEADVYSDGWFDDPNYVHVTINNPGDANWSVQLHQPVTVDSGHVYEIWFLADAPTEKAITVLMQATFDPYKEHFNQAVTIDQFSEYGPFVYEADTTLSQMAFKFILGADANEILIDDVRVIDTMAPASAVGTRPAANAGRVESFELLPNFPNPFNPSTRIRFNLEQAEHVQVTISNVRGQRVRLLAETWLEAGSHTVEWDGTDTKGNTAPGGVYIVTLRSLEDGRIDSRKLILMK